MCAQDDDNGKFGKEETKECFLTLKNAHLYKEAHCLQQKECCFYCEGQYILLE